MKYIPLTRGQRALIDDGDYELVSGYKWNAHKSKVNSGFYARTSLKRVKGSRPTLLMHVLLLNPDPNQQVDHKNGNGLDNRRANLRIVSAKQNIQNQKLRVNNTSGYKGVCLIRGKWQVSIWVNEKRLYLGRFTNKEDAAKAYDEAAKKYFGEFARLNKERE